MGDEDLVIVWISYIHVICTELTPRRLTYYLVHRFLAGTYI